MNDNERDNEQQVGPGTETETSGAAAPPEELSREELDLQLELAKAEIERLTDQSLRRQAELINYRRRVQKEQAQTVIAAQAALLEGLVPVIDDFERAVETESKDAGAYHEGMQIILRSVHKVLESIGVERIEPRGEAFDPRYHEAIGRHETDEVPDGHVLDVCQAGYRLNDRLIRPASVVVAFGGAVAESDAAEDRPEPAIEVDALLAKDGEAEDA
ncbi:MAG: nucleotide exchange factor GrpE [Acidobacteria bacterium]|nr:nucleotide exchange factor GrpE [Acidobacteriota bacterium]